MSVEMCRVLLKWCLMSLFVAGAVGGALSACEEPTDPRLEAPETVQQTEPSANPPAAATRATAMPGSPGDYRRLAEQGDVPSMILLGRAHESVRQRAEARKWYQKAADAGSSEAQQALATLDEPATPPQRTAGDIDPLPDLPTEPSFVRADRAAAAAASAAQTGKTPAANATTAPTARAASTRRVVRADPNKLAWQEILACYDTTGFPTKTGKNKEGKFQGVNGSPDGTIIMTASGPSEGDIDGIKALIRVKNRTLPEASPRVGEMAAVVALVTHNNVTPAEFEEWIKTYLDSFRQLPPIYRNGWQITITGPDADKVPDANRNLGTAVAIGLKR